MPIPPSVSDTVEARVLELVDKLVDELRGTEFGRRAAPGDSLERDLGISSLERVELLVRLERAFGVRLGDTVMADAKTPAELAAVVATTELAAVEAIPEIQPPTASATPPKPSARTLVEAFEFHVQQTPNRVHIYLRKEDGSETPLTYSALWKQSVAVAKGLTVHGLGHGDTVAIMLRTEPAFFSSFFGTLLAGCVPVPLYPPFRADQIEEYARRQVGILHNAGARLMITFAEVERVAALLVGQVPSLKTVVTEDMLVTDGSDRPGLRPSRRLTSEDSALIQYTSGSTGHPKGVLLSHANLLANIRAIQISLDIGPDDVGVSWLPLYHDMGLIGAWLGMLYLGTPLVLMSPLAFLARPARWLWALHSHRGTLSPAPNFAYDLCVNRIAHDEIEGLDLSSVRVLLNGSEAVLPETLERFTARFAPYGFQPGALAPVYGLAECTVGLTAPPVGRRARIDCVDRRALEEQGQAVPAAEEEPAARFVSCGRALPGHKIRVVDDTGALVGERREGNVQFLGPSATSGYYRDQEATRKLVRADGWLETGDLGYLVDGELFLTGRRKDLIIKGGRNLHPHEVEAIVGDVAGVRKGCVAAFGMADRERGTERLVIVAETRAAAGAEHAEIHSAIIARCTAALGLPPDIVVLSPPGSVLKTSSGKIRRAATRDAYRAGRLKRGRPTVAWQWLRLLARAGIGRLRREIGTLLRVVFTAHVLILLLLTGPFVWGLLAIGPPGPWANRLVGRWARVLFALAGCQIDVVGIRRLREIGPAVYVANHASYLDPVLIMAMLPVQARFAVKHRLLQFPFLGTAIRKGEHIPIKKADLSQQMEGTSAIAAALKTGASLFIFPEGTFDATPRLLPFRLGAFRVAVDAGRPIVPIAIRGTRRILPANTLLLRPGSITITVGSPIHPSSGEWQEIIRIRDTAYAVIAKGAGEL
jgi:fatty-acyl-CoA synthase